MVLVNSELTRQLPQCQVIIMNVDTTKKYKCLCSSGVISVRR